MDTSHLSLLRWAELTITFQGKVCIPEIHFLISGGMRKWRSQKTFSPRNSTGFLRGKCTDSSQHGSPLVIWGKDFRLYLACSCHFSFLSDPGRRDPGSIHSRFLSSSHPPHCPSSGFSFSVTLATENLQSLGSKYACFMRPFSGKGDFWVTPFLSHLPPSLQDFRSLPFLSGPRQRLPLPPLHSLKRIQSPSVVC